MSIDVDELSGPAGDAVKFTTIGDKVVGTVTFIGEWRDRVNKFGKEETVMKVVLDTPDGPKAIYPAKGSPMAQAIGDAIRATGGTKFEKGATLGIEYNEDKDIGKGNPLKLFRAQYKAPAPVAASIAAEDLF